ncbi:MAG: glucose-1-phosphate adenylyltransferase subunit GlgD [Oscillospiraceae bacterium]|nr:glucose-1-phosphate adenylyltransferase subunit GlgD [Oscillospiraceae bacterium]
MSQKKALGIIFANMHDSNLGEFTHARSMGSLPFGGRYRLIDFSLSSLVGAGVTKVGVIAKSNYHSLMDHLGNGREWDLARKHDGLSILPPYRTGQETETLYHGRIQALYNALGYIRASAVSYVVLSDCDYVANVDLNAALEYHESTGADVTFICCSMEPVEGEPFKSCVVLRPDGDGRVRDMMIDRYEDGCVMSMNMFIIGKEKLISMIEEAMSRMLVFFERDVLLKNIDTLDIRCFIHEGFARRIFSLRSYCDANMALLDQKNLRELFNPRRPVYTKVRDEAPVRYGLHAEVKNCLVADGCVIEGTARNSVLFRGVKIAAGATVENSILMQGTEIGESAALSCVITDKIVRVSDSRTLCGHTNYPLYIKKASIV